LSLVVIADPGWRNERHIVVGDLSLGWRVNGAARLSCRIRARDAHLFGYAELLGRWIYHSGPCGEWGGYIEDTPVDMGSGIMELSCIDHGGLLAHSTVPRTYRQYSSAPGMLIKRAMQDSALDDPLWIDSVSCDGDGSPVTVEWRGEQTGRVVQSLASGAAGIWTVRTDTNKAIEFVYASGFTDKRGSILLYEGHNVIDGSVRPTISQLVNDILGVANDRNWQQSAGARVIDADSVLQFGRRKDTRSYLGHTRASSLQSVARADLTRSSVITGPVSLQIPDRNKILRDLRECQVVRLASSSANRLYDLTVTGRAHDTTRGVVTVVGTVIES
jgi:hypothetical protein